MAEDTTQQDGEQLPRARSALGFEVAARVGEANAVLERQDPTSSPPMANTLCGAVETRDYLDLVMALHICVH